MPEFTNILRQVAQDLKRNFHSRIPAQPEDQLKPGVQQLLRATARHVETRTEAYAIRPGRWTAAMTKEFLELLWVLEATIPMFPEMERMLAAIISNPTFPAAALPSPPPPPAGHPARRPLREQPHIIP